MRCKQARQLFDAYLDGGLSPALKAELGAHRVQCAECRRALALLEVSGQILASDRDPVELRHDFSERLLACMDEPKAGPWHRVKYTLYYAGPLAAAALIALAFMGVFDRSNGTNGQGLQVAGEVVHHEGASPALSDNPEPAESAEAERDLDRWIEQTQKDGEATRRSVESLQQAFDLTVGQWLEILEQAKDVPAAEEHVSGADASSDEASPEEEHPAVDPDDTVD